MPIAIDAATINARRCREYNKYIEATNKKAGGLFLDTIDVREYDPRVLNKAGLKSRLEPLSDPTKRIIQKQLEETNLLSTDKMEHGGRTREMLSVLQWGEGKIEVC